MSALPEPTDASLAVAAGAGDSAALGGIYDRYADRLFGFCNNMLRGQSDAEDCLQDVFVIAATRLRDLREPTMLRSWLFSVARHECLNRLDKKKREVLVDEFDDRALVDTGPSAAITDTDLATLLADVGGGLSDRDRLLLELADRQELSGDELAKAIGVPRSTAYTLVARARTTARNSIGALLVARTGREQCEQLDALLTGWDGKLTTARRKQINRHIEQCEICEEQRKRVATPAALLGEGRAFAAELVSFRTRILEAAAAAASIGLQVGDGNWGNGWPPSDDVFTVPGRRRRRLAALLLFVLLLIGGGTAVATLHTTHHDVVALSTSPAAPTKSSPLPANLIPTTLAPPTSGTPASTSASPTASPTPSPTVSVTVTSGGRVIVIPVPPTTPTVPSPGAPSTTPSAPPTSAPPTSPSAPPTSSTPANTWTLIVHTASLPASVAYSKASGGNTSVTCAAESVCTYQVVKGAPVKISAQPNRTLNGVFTAPSTCSGDLNTCSFDIASDVTAQLADRQIVR